MKTVMLDYASKEFTVTEEGYALIRALIQQHQLCDKCRQPIDEDTHRLVGKNLCLACLLTHQPDLTFVGIEQEHDDGETTYSYVDTDGIVYTSRSDYSEQAKKDIYSSILRAGFPVPEVYKPFKAEEAVKLNRSDWTIYGKLTASVIVLDYHEYYGQRLRATFLSYKGSQVVELTKRNSTQKQLFERAHAVVESTKHGSYYHLDGYELSQRFDSTLYPLIAQMEAAVYDVQRQFAQGGSAK
jgi:NADPH-dependent 7-cyano-7-deazaguanine reductase QueF